MIFICSCTNGQLAYIVKRTLHSRCAWWWEFRLLSLTDHLQNNILPLKNKFHIFMPLCNIHYKKCLIYINTTYWPVNQRSIWNTSSKCLKTTTLRLTFKYVSSFGIYTNCLRLAHCFDFKLRNLSEDKSLQCLANQILSCSTIYIKAYFLV